MTSIATDGDEYVCVTPETPDHVRLEITHGIQSTDVVLTLPQARLLVFALNKLLAPAEEYRPLDPDEDPNEGLGRGEA